MSVFNFYKMFEIILNNKIRKFMANNIFLISTDDLKSETLINYNLDDVITGRCIKNCQEIFLRDIIGDKLLSKLKDLASAELAGEDIPEPYLTLIDTYVFNYLLYKVQCEICIAVSFKIRNIGVSVDSDTNVQTLQLEGVEKLRDYYETFAIDAENRLIDYLKNNDIPEVDKCKLHKESNISLYLGGR